MCCLFESHVLAVRLIVCPGKFMIHSLNSIQYEFEMHCQKPWDIKWVELTRLLPSFSFYMNWKIESGNSLNEALRIFSFTMLCFGYALAMYKFKKTRVFFFTNLIVCRLIFHKKRAEKVVACGGLSGGVSYINYLQSFIISILYITSHYLRKAPHTLNVPL